MVNEFCGFKHGVIGKDKLPADTTLNNMKKADLIKLLHIAQDNYETLMCFYNNAVKFNEKRLNGGGWIPCSERLPEYSDIYEVTATNGRGMKYIEFAYYDKPRGEWWKYDDSGIVNVRAWKEHSEPYKAESEE